MKSIHAQTGGLMFSSVCRPAGLAAGVLMIVGGSACMPTGPGGSGGQRREVTLNFRAQVGDQPAACGQMFTGLGTTAASAEIMDMRLYVSNVRLVTEDGREVALDLEQDGQFQVENVALLDFEDATGGCGDGGTSAVNARVHGTVPEGDYHGVMFDIGVPFALNHLDVTADPPLDVSAMFWVWQIGRKFIRVDLRMEDGTGWNMHLGSTMCESAAPTAAPAAQCGRLNQPTVVMDEFNAETDTIVLDLRELFAASDLSQETPETSPGCQSFPDDVNECTDLFPMLGLDFTSGACIDGCANQRIFRIDSPVVRGQELFTTARTTTGGQMLSCASCHADDGAGNIGPDIRPSTVEHLVEHSQGDGPHPDGVKFPDLTATQYEEIEAFLRHVCEAADGCTPGSADSGEDHEHDE